MRRTAMTALTAVFLSLLITGCYTKLKGPEPGTGERVYQNYYNDYPYYYDYYNPFYFNYGWYSPFYFGYPSYYGSFYSPWWYDPYYYGNGGYYRPGNGTPPGKEPRGRGVQRPQQPSVPSGSYSPPPPSSSGQGETGYQPPPPSSGNQGSSGGENPNNSSGGKTTRGRR